LPFVAHPLMVLVYDRPLIGLHCFFSFKLRV
jgi:hypothetical protein